TGRPAEALKAFAQARAVRQRLADADPADNQFQGELARLDDAIGRVHEYTGAPAEALKAFAQARALWQRLAGEAPAIPQYRSELAWNQYHTGRVLVWLRRVPEALPLLDQAQALCQKLTEARPGVPGYVLRLGYSHAFRGAGRVRAGQPAAAAADLRRALGLMAKNTAPDEEDHFERARALALLAGLGAEAASGVTAAEGAAFAEQALAALRAAVAADWPYLSELDEPDFTAVRQRDDFKKLAQELRA